MMNEPYLADAFYLLGLLWVEELQPEDMALVASLPDLAAALPRNGSAGWIDLAVEYQRLFGFNLPPYESIFLDPSAMLNAPATARVQQLYRQAGWAPPSDVRAGAVDHVGVELLAVGMGLAQGQTDFARGLLEAHLALWVPPFVYALKWLDPPAFYQVLADLTLGLLLDVLEPQPDRGKDLFPALPPAPDFQAHGMPASEESPQEIGLREVVIRLLTPRKAGLFLTREHLQALGQDLALPVGMGERYRMLEMLFRLAGQYEVVESLVEQLIDELDRAAAFYQELAVSYPVWELYGQAWCRRLSKTRTFLEHLCLEASYDE